MKHQSSHPVDIAGESGPAQESVPEPKSNAVVPESTATADEPAERQDSDPRRPASVGAEPRRWSRAIAFGLLPALALLLVTCAGFLKWHTVSKASVGTAASATVLAATEGTIALLSYRPDTVEADLESARTRLTGQFLDSYTSLTRDVVIPGAKHKEISAVATVPAAAAISATGSHASVLLFVNQLISVGKGAPTNTASSVRVSLDKVAGRWLISSFDPV